jgi:hypothetical protein
MFMVSTDGLSPLQRSILVLAYDNWTREGRSTQSEGCDGYFYEILERVWHFENRWAGASRERTPTHWHFGLRQIPYRRYNAAMASLSRSVKRLTDWGLVTRHRGKSWRGTWAGMKLTATGLPVAKRLWEAWLAGQVLARYRARKASGSTAP